MVTPAPDFTGLRVLLVEDNALNREVALGLLAPTNCELLIAEDGFQAVHLAERESLDCILMDIQMPAMDGYEATRRIRAMETRTHLPIIAMTAIALREDQERATKAGMDDFVFKPIDPSVLYAVVTKWLQPAERRAARPAVDLEYALRLVRGDHAALQRVLGHFSRDHARAVEDIRQAWFSGNIELATRHPHTLKGLAGTVGAQALSDATKRLETALAEQRGASVKTLLISTEEHLQAALSFVAGYYSEFQDPSASGPPPSESGEFATAEHVLNQLASRLSEGDSSASEIMTLLEQLPLPTSCRRQLPLLRRAIQSFDFERALSIVFALADQLDIQVRLR